MHVSERYLTRCYMVGRECPEAVLRDRALYLPTFSHLLIVSKLPSHHFIGAYYRRHLR